MIPMKLKPILLLILCFIALLFHKSMFSQTVASTIPPDIQFVVDNEITRLADNICKLILRGHSLDEVVAMVDDGQPHGYDTQKLAFILYKILSQQCSQGNSMDFVKEDKKTSTSGLHLWAKAKRTSRILLTLKITFYLVIIAVVLVALFLLYKHFSPYIKQLIEYINRLIKRLNRLFAILQFCGSRESNNGSENKNTHPETTSPITEEKIESPQEKFDQSNVNQKPFTKAKQPVEGEEQIQNITMENPQVEQCPQNQNVCKIVINQTRSFYFVPRDPIIKLFEQVKNCKLYPTTKQLDIPSVIPAASVEIQGGIRKKYHDMISEIKERADKMHFFPIEKLPDSIRRKDNAQ